LSSLPSAIFSRRPRWAPLPARAAALLLLLTCPGYPQVVDCIVAEVDAQVITLTDIRILLAFSIRPEVAGDESPSPVRQILEGVIYQKMIIGMVRENIAVTGEEVAALLAELKKGFEAEEWRRKLEAFGLEEQDLSPYLEEKLRYQKIIRLRFIQNVDVNLKEIEQYYSEVYVPAETALGREPRPMTQVLDDIEAQVKKKKTELQVAFWLRSLRGRADITVNADCLELIK
jgi:DNA-binding transcriptional MerR regulator